MKVRKRDQIIFVPYNSKYGELNSYARRMQEVWMDKYRIVRKEMVSNRIREIVRTKAIVLNWTENSLDNFLKRKLYLYKLLGIKIIWTFHNKLPHDSENKKKEDILWLQKHSTKIIVHSTSSISELDRRYRDKACYVPHINYIGAYEEKKINIREMHHVAQKEFLFAFIGLIRPYKNIELLIRVFDELKLPNAKLMICGKPMNTVYAKRLIECSKKNQNIVWVMKFIPDNEIVDYVQAADVHVLPYSQKSSMNSGAMIMDFSYERTVITSSIAMAIDMEKEKFMYIYKYKNEKEEYERLKKMMKLAYENGREKNIEMGKKACLFMKNNNGREKVGIALEKLCN